MKAGTLCYATSNIPSLDIGNYTYFGIFHEGKTLLCVTNFKNGMEPEMTFAPNDTFKELTSNMRFSLNLSKEISNAMQLYIDLYSEKVQELCKQIQDKNKINTLNEFKEKYLSAEQNSGTKAQLKF